MSIKEKELKKSKCKTDRAKRITMLWSGLKTKNQFFSMENYKNISLNLNNPSSSIIQKSESVPYLSYPYLSDISLQKSSTNNAIEDFCTNHDDIQAIFNNKYYSNEVKTKLYVLPNNAVIKDRFIQQSLIGNDPRYYHMKKMVRFWNCFCNYACPKITIGKFLVSRKCSDELKNNCVHYHSQNYNKNPIKLTKLPVLHTNSSSNKNNRRNLNKKQVVKQVYSNIDIKRLSMDNDVSNNKE